MSGKRPQRLHSNKEMVATYGADCLPLPKSTARPSLFEASVGGGTPIIAHAQCLAANHISSIRGIVNGTTNFMLTKMKRENMGFDEALKIAHSSAMPTKDPGDDVDGRDACRKIAILASLACGHHVYPDNIPTRGIRDITVADIKAAEKLDSAIKLIAWYDEGEDRKHGRRSLSRCSSPTRTSLRASMTCSTPF